MAIARKKHHAVSMSMDTRGLIWWNTVKQSSSPFLPSCYPAHISTLLKVMNALCLHLVIWNHDESTYHANDQRKIRWVNKSKMAVPYTKGEGQSVMIAELISPNYGFLKSPDGFEQARVVFKFLRLARTRRDTSCARM